MKRAFRPVLFVAAALALSSGAAAPEARAQPGAPRREASANELMQGATDDYKKGDCASAAQKLERVIELAPDTVNARVALGICEEKLGLLASAWEHYRQAEQVPATPQNASLRAEARRLRSALTPRLARLTIEVPEPVARLPGLTVLRDGVQVDATQWGEPQPVNKGTHTIKATATGKQRWEATIEITSEGVTESVRVGPLNDDPPSKPSETRAGPSLSSTRAPAPLVATPPTPPPRGSALRTTGLVIAGVGLATLGAAAVTGAVAMSKKKESDAHCNGDVCDPTGFNLRTSGLTFAAVSTGTFIAGSTLLVGGAAVFVLAPRAKDAGPTIGVGPGAINAQWVF